jgi:threonyl-tRNA synthetase
MSSAPINITLPDGKKISLPQPLTVADFAATISRSLAKAAIAGKVNGALVDLSCRLDKDAAVTIITASDPEGLDIIRHSAAHLLAHAVKELYPQAQPTIGPVIEDGFYYDFYYPQGFSESELVAIEARMKEIAKRAIVIERMVMSREEAVQFFEQRDEDYKVKLIHEIPAGEQLTLYKQGDFVDLCRGPHLANTAALKAFKLTKLSGAYWKGDAKNEVLQRVYGTAWADQKALDEYLKRIEEAKLRDHRLLGQKMDLFHLQPESPGMVFWHPNGWIIYKALRDYVAQNNLQYGYKEVCTPFILDRVLWEISGHWDNYDDKMFITESEKHLYALKPMNCPGQIQIFKHSLKSYRDLPVRLSEFGFCHRNEYSGTLHGLFRVRGFIVDDGHIFCTDEQLVSEALAYMQQLVEMYSQLGFKDLIIRLATRPEKRIGADELWDKAEQALQQVLDQLNLKWEYNHGDGAFYGPKIEVSLRDCLGRVWQCGTLQADFSLPERFEVHYIAEDGSKKCPVMLHRAMLGSLERFIGILLEHTGGNLPLWLAPQQAVVLNITDDHADYARAVAKELQNSGLRVNFDLRNEKIGFKIRDHSIHRVPYLLVVGNKEKSEGKVAVRLRDGKDLGVMTIDEIKSLMVQEVKNKNVG